MPPHDEGALDKREKELFSNKYAGDGLERHSSVSAGTTEVPTSWSSETIQNAPVRTRTSFGIIALTFSLLALLGALLFLGYKILTQDNIVSDAKIDIALLIKPYVEGGEITPLTYSVNNSNTLPLLNATLTVSYDKGTGAQDEQNKIRQTIDLGTIGAQELRKGDISVQLFGAENTQRSISARLEYKVQGSNAVFSKTISVNSILKTPPVSIRLDSDATPALGEPYPITLTIKNNTSTSSGPILVSLVAPSSYVVTSTSEKALNRGLVWKLDDLGQGTEKVITIQGSFKGATGETVTIKGIVGSQGAQIYDIGNVYSYDSKELTLSESALSLTLSATQDSGNASVSTILPNQRMHGSILYNNSSSMNLTNTRIVATLSGAYDSKSVNVENNGLYDSSAHTITWSGAALAALKAISPGEQGTLGFTVIPLLNGSTPLSVNVSGDADTSDGGQHVTSKTQKNWFIQGGSQVSGYLTYKLSLFTNTGPLPPKVNTATTYTVNLSARVENGAHNGRVSLTLPLYVTWTNLFDKGVDISYDDRSRVVTWNIGDMPAGSSVTGHFQISVRPSQTHVGGIPPVTSGISFDAVDAISGQALKNSAPPITTSLPDETSAKDNATVVQ